MEMTDGTPKDVCISYACPKYTSCARVFGCGYAHDYMRMSSGDFQGVVTYKCGPMGGFALYMEDKSHVNDTKEAKQSREVDGANAISFDTPASLTQLKQLRAEHGISQVELSRMTGLHVAALSRIESGKCNPTLDTLNKILSRMGYELCIKPHT